MNNEIKEILRNCEKAINEASGYNDTTDKILDYITNLQKTNKNHSKKLIELGDKITNLQQDNEKIGKLWREEEAHCILLQQENERLKLEYKSQKDINQKLLSMDIKHNRELKDYKSRCEKADNQLKIIMQILKEQPNRSIKDDEWLENRLIGVEYILKNGGK